MTDYNALAARLERLERQNRRMKRIGIATIAVAGIAFLLGAQGDKPEVLSEIRVKKLVVVDDAGTTRGFLGLNADGHTLLDLKDRSGRRRAYLFVNESNRRTLIGFHQSDGTMRVGGGCEDNGSAWMNTLNRRGKATNGVSSKP